MNSRKYGVAIALVGIAAVVIGAFGAHGLRDVLSPDRLKTYQTGVTYHFYHLLAACASYIILVLSDSKWAARSFWMFLIGILSFSGSIYGLACRDVIGLTSWKWLGPITPIGGVFFMIGWLFLGAAIVQLKESRAANDDI